MPFIGIIAKECDSNFIKNEVLKNSTRKKFEFLNINQKNIENIKNIRFETLVIDENIEELLENSKYLECIIKNAKYLIINSDIVKDVCVVGEGNYNIITYGLNQHATVTISSVKEENILICVQKNFQNIEGKNIDVQEVNIKLAKNNLKKLCNSLSIFTILSIYGENLKKI